MCLISYVLKLCYQCASSKYCIISEYFCDCDKAIIEVYFLFVGGSGYT